ARRGAPRAWVASRPLVNGDVHEVLRSDVPVERPQETVVLPVLDDLGRPSRDPRDREHRCEEVRRNPEALEDEPRVEVDVRIYALRADLPYDRLLDGRRDSIQSVVPGHVRELPRELLLDEGPRIVRLVD